VYNIGSKFDGGACAYKNCQRLPVTVSWTWGANWCTGDP